MTGKKARGSRGGEGKRQSNHRAVGAASCREAWFKRCPSVRFSRVCGATWCSLGHVRLHTVSIHAPARGATQWNGHNVYDYTFQSTLPRGERLLFANDDGWFDTVSIHAPARGATQSPLRSSFNTSVSIHAPARGATSVLSVKYHTVKVSIHAPARGATLIMVWYRNRCLFQSTLPRGERHLIPTDVPCLCCFNPRSRAGSDRDGRRRYIYQRVSIHAPARGATPPYG